MQLADMRARVSQRLNESGGATFYPAGEIDAALNEALRFFCFLTLCLQKTSAWSVPGATPFTHMLGVFSDWIAPLRIADASGAKIRPAKIADLTSLDSSWCASPGSPQRYVSLGADLVGIYPQPAGGATLQVTYARAPIAIADDADVPEIPAEYHARLVDYAIYRCRQVEGLQEFQKSLKYLESFLEGARHLATYVRDRNKESRYDKMPFDLVSFDASMMLGGK